MSRIIYIGMVTDSVPGFAFTVYFLFQGAVIISQLVIRYVPY